MLVLFFTTWDFTLVYLYIHIWRNTYMYSIYIYLYTTSQRIIIFLLPTLRSFFDFLRWESEAPDVVKARKRSAIISILLAPWRSNMWWNRSWEGTTAMRWHHWEVMIDSHCILCQSRFLKYKWPRFFCFLRGSVKTYQCLVGKSSLQSKEISAGNGWDMAGVGSNNREPRSTKMADQSADLSESSENSHLQWTYSQKKKIEKDSFARPGLPFLACLFLVCQQ